MPVTRVAAILAQVFAVRDGTTLDRPLRAAVIGGGPAGACTAETLAKGGIETYLIERKLDNCKVSLPFLHTQTSSHGNRLSQLQRDSLTWLIHVGCMSCVVSDSCSGMQSAATSTAAG